MAIVLFDSSGYDCCTAIVGTVVFIEMSVATEGFLL